MRTDEQKALNTFDGSNAVLDFLDPDNAPYTPLVEIPDHVNPYRKNGVRIFAKLMNALPLANIKSLPAYNMLAEKRKNGELDGIDTVIENSSGNTVFSLAVIARLMGIHHTKGICSHQVSVGKLNLLRLLGTEVIVNKEPICPDPNDKTSGIYKAKLWSMENNWFNPGQYDNEANPAAHYKWTGPQIWNQTKGNISILSVGLGTTGSAVGIGRYLKEKKSDVKVVGISRAANNPVPGVRTNNLLQEIAFDWKSVVDHHEEIGTVESYKTSMELCRSGLFVGPSSGFALAGLLKHISKQTISNKETVAVFICPDSPFPYVDEYFQYLDPSLFPKIENEHLLSSSHVETAKKIDQKIDELTPNELFHLAFEHNAEKIQEQISKNEQIKLKRKFLLIDVRDKEEYMDHHIPTSINVPFDMLNDYLNINKNELMKNESIIFICRRGNTSMSAAMQSTKKYGTKSISLKGGVIEWSRLNLPRVKSNTCPL